ncbi:multicopper oxidase-domain-containing protein [Lasiosphaeria hispida]|uniref:Multicopper oxidase-domain-containing protein n=1 Tax=Lasiosphaeria hispida TaxID=260671 RepID=A0AAJ0H5V1_9PEZI|nr:multicopper oxidase-domain-containing protein [Lasiosphaeria hispida]
MKLLDQLWALLTYLITISSNLLPERDFELSDQVALGIPTHIHIDPPRGPVFKPPGGHPGDDTFQCDYSAMVGFKDCSAKNTSCWLTNGDITFDIGTDYEGLNSNGDINMPVGIKRSYTIIAQDGSYFADGLEFSEAKLFRDITKPAAQYPGPWIQACWGDLIEITVLNSLSTNGTSIHWHGIRQWFNMQADGVNGVTQCPIAPGDQFVYTFNATQYGSSWYHSHYTIQYADGLVGPITLHGPSSAQYDVAPEQPLLFTDWIHNSAFSLLRHRTTLSPSILLNGIGNVNTFAGQPVVDPKLIPTPYTVNVGERTANATRFLLRLINTSFGSTFVVTIDSHMMQVIEVDFVPIQAYTTKEVFIGIGQRFNVIVELDGSAPPGENDFWIRAYIPENCTGEIEPNRTSPYEQVGIFHYGAAAAQTPTSTPWANLDLSCTDEPYASITPVVEWIVPPTPANQPTCDTNCSGEVEDITTGDTPPSDYPLAFFGLNPTNLSSWTPFRIDYSQPAFLNLNLSRNWTANELVVPEDYTAQDWIYLTICDDSYTSPHPLHLHGHDFAILQVGTQSCGSLLPSDLSLRRDNPARRDVVLVPVGGFVIIAFKTDNPGNWLMHCHIAKHAAEGLGLQILERQPDALRRWPDANHSHAVAEAQRVCQNWNPWWATSSEVQDDSGV